MMDITIFGTVRNAEKETINISIHSDEIEEIIKAKAIAAGVRGYEGTAWTHYDETITKVIIGD